MVRKSICITEEAYNALKRRKINDESFSEAIVRIFNNKKGAAAGYFGCLSHSAESLEILQSKVKEYRRNFTKAF